MRDCLAIIFWALLTCALLASPRAAQAQASTEELEERSGLVHKAGEKTPFTGQAIDLHQSGKTRLEAHYADGRLTSSKVWYENGQLAEEVSVSAGVWTIRRFTENGRLEEETVAAFEGGRKVSEQSRMWDEAGRLRGEAGFKAGKLHGPLKEYDASGALTRDELYEQGKLIRKNK